MKYWHQILQMLQLPILKLKDLDFEQMLSSKMGFGKVNISTKDILK